MTLSDSVGAERPSRLAARAAAARVTALSRSTNGLTAGKGTRPRRALLRPACVARGRAAHHLERQERALAARGGDVDAELLDHPVGAEAPDLVDRHPDQLLGGDRGGGLRDRAALPVEAQVLHAAILHNDVHAQLVAAERVVVVPLEIVLLELPEVPGALVVLEDEVAVEGVHQSSNTSRAFTSASTRRSTSSREL